MEPLPDREWICNGDPAYERRLRAMLESMPPIRDRADAGRCFDMLVADKLIQVEHLDTQPFRFFLCHELVACHDLNLVFLMSAHFNLYAGTLLRLGSARHGDAMARADAGEVGCFALTEERHGVTSGLWIDTTATYDRERGGFVLRSPAPRLRKFWITNAGYFARNAVVMARLLAGGADHGLHGFWVPLRPAAGAPTFPGISIEDVGEKTCLPSTDIAHISFDDVFVPRDNLLDRYTRVDERGEVDSELAGLRPHEQLERIANQLLSGRACIAGITIATAEKGLAVTVRHARTRTHQTGPDSSLSLWRHASYRHQLIPLLAEAYVRRAFTSAVHRAYAQSVSKTEAELVRAICAAKATNTSFARSTLAQCQEMLGSAGLLRSEVVGDLHNASFAALLIEGDSRVLLHKIARDELRALRKGGIPRAMGRAIATRLGRRALRDHTALGKLLEQRALFQGMFLARKLRKRRGAAATAAWFEELEDEVLSYAQAVCDHLVWRNFDEQAAGRDLGVDRLFALRCIQRDPSGFARFTTLRARHLARVPREIRRLCDALEAQLDRLLPAQAPAEPAADQPGVKTVDVNEFRRASALPARPAFRRPTA